MSVSKKTPYFKKMHLRRGFELSTIA